MLFHYDLTDEDKIINTQEEFDLWIKGKELWDIWVEDDCHVFWCLMDVFLRLPFEIYD